MNKIEEYTTHGTPMREICLEPDMELWHAIQLSTGDYVVTSRPHESQWVVSIVGEDGIVRRTSQSLDVTYMHEASLAVTKKQCHSGR